MQTGTKCKFESAIFFLVRFKTVKLSPLGRGLSACFKHADSPGVDGDKNPRLKTANCWTTVQKGDVSDVNINRDSGHID